MSDTPDTSAFHLYEAEVDVVSQDLLHRCCLRLPVWVKEKERGNKAYIWCNEMMYNTHLCYVECQKLTPCPKPLVKPP